MLPEEVVKLIGRTGGTIMMEVEKGAIKKFADAVDDRNPVHWDEEYARHSRYGTIVAPQGFFGWPIKWTGQLPRASKFRQELLDTLTRAGFGRILDGGVEFEFFYPVRAGDTLSSLATIVDIRETEGKGGKMILSIMEITYTNQNGDLVAKERSTLIHR